MLKPPFFLGFEGVASEAEVMVDVTGGGAEVIEFRRAKTSMGGTMEGGGGWTRGEECGGKGRGGSIGGKTGGSGGGVAIGWFVAMTLFRLASADNSSSRVSLSPPFNLNLLRLKKIRKNK